MTKLEEFVDEEIMKHLLRHANRIDQLASQSLLCAFIKLVRDRAEKNEGFRGRIIELTATGIAFNEVVKELGLEEK